MANAQQKLVTPQREMGSVVELRQALSLVEKTLAEAMTYTLGIVEGMGQIREEETLPPTGYIHLRLKR